MPNIQKFYFLLLRNFDRLTSQRNNLIVSVFAGSFLWNVWISDFGQKIRDIILTDIKHELGMWWHLNYYHHERVTSKHKNVTSHFIPLWHLWHPPRVGSILKTTPIFNCFVFFESILRLWKIYETYFGQKQLAAVEWREILLYNRLTFLHKLIFYKKGAVEEVFGEK